MKCVNCGLETKAGNFCEHCGANQSIAATTELQSKLTQNQSINLPKVSLNKKTKIILVSCITLAVILFSGYKIGMSMTSPQSVATKYLTALQNKDYATAYNYIQGNTSIGLSKDAFIAWQKNEEKVSGSINFFTLPTNDAAQNQGNDTTVAVTQKREKDTDKRNGTLDLVSTSKIAGIFPNWKIILPETSSSFSLNFDGANLYLDGINTGLVSSPNKSVSIQTYVGNHTFIFQAKNAVPLDVSSGYQNNEMTPTDEVNNAVKNAADTFAKEFVASYTTSDTTNINPSSLHGGQGLKTWVLNQYKDMQSNFDTLTSADSAELSNVNMLSPTKITADISFNITGHETSGFEGDPGWIGNDNVYCYGVTFNYDNNTQQWIPDLNQGGNN